MKYIANYHILMINNWEQIVNEQLSIIKKSGLYDELDAIRIGALGEDIETLQKIIKRYPKCDIVRYHNDVNKYEFFTLKILWYEAQNQKPYYALYFHTKGVSFPDNTGGKYWRDYMNHYNLKEYKECIKKLRKGYDTCGVKLLTKQDLPAKKLHYSGNFYWCKSSYVKRLVDPESMNQANRFEAEFWIGTGEPTASSLCQMFVDYNTKGEFKHAVKGTNYVHTLAYNLPSEVEKATRLLYLQNDNFIHYIVDLGFPLASDTKIDIEEAKKINTERLKEICVRYGSVYLKAKNIGVSQNWTQVFNHLNMKDEDVLIGADPDEHTQDHGWVNAMADVLRSGYGLVSLMMLDHIEILKKYNPVIIDGHSVLKAPTNINWALIGMSGKFLKAMGEVPYPKDAERYGWIESMIQPYFKKLNTTWGVLTDYRVKHTDYAKNPIEFLNNPNGCQLDEPGSSRILREWKNLIVFKKDKYGQISLDEYIQRKQNGEFKS